MTKQNTVKNHKLIFSNQITQSVIIKINNPQLAKLNSESSEGSGSLSKKIPLILKQNYNFSKYMKFGAIS